MPTATINDNLLSAIKARQTKQAEHNYGIMTADRYTRTLLDCAGSDLCYRYAARKGRSFDDALRKAAKTLTYNNPDMVLEEQLPTKSVQIDGQAIEIPKQTLLVFRHTLTTPRKDRDGDILRTGGAKPDPKMLLLWQHTHTLPIGKMLGIAEHTSKRLSVYTAIVDVNALAHDAAVMVESKMGRFSHGFRALEFSEVKAEPGKTTGGGFDVKSFEIMEISLVSVPSNVDAETEEVILGMVEGGKLTSPLMKGIGKQIRTKRPKTVPVTVDVNLLINGKKAGGDPDDDEDDDDFDDGLDLAQGKTKAAGKPGCTCHGKPASEKTDEGDDEGTDAEGNKVSGKEVDQDHADAHNDMGPVLCPVCGIAAGADGKCPQCGHVAKKSTGQKAGRVLSAKNYKALEDVTGELEKVEGGMGMWSAKQSCRKCINTLKEVLTAATPAEAATMEITAKDAATLFVAKASSDERKRLIKTLQVMDDIERKQNNTARYNAINSN